MYAVLVTVKFDPSSKQEDATKYLNEEIVPRAKQAPGFVKGIWFGDGKRGHAVSLFESEKHAQDMANRARTGPANDPATTFEIESITVYEVHAEA